MEMRRSDVVAVKREEKAKAALPPDAGAVAVLPLPVTQSLQYVTKKSLTERGIERMTSVGIETEIKIGVGRGIERGKKRKKERGTKRETGRGITGERETEGEEKDPGKRCVLHTEDDPSDPRTTF